MTTNKLREFLAQGAIDRQLQNNIIIAVYDWLRSDYPELKLNLGEYEVDGSNGRTNAAASIMIGSSQLIDIVYIEHANSFMLYSNRMIALVGRKNGMSGGMPAPFMFPDKCFGRSAQDLADAYQWVIQRCFDSFFEEHETMDRSSFQKTIDDALEAKDFTKLKMLDPIIKTRL